MVGRGAERGTGRGRGTSSPSTSSPSTSAMPGSTQETSSPSPYLAVLNPEYHGPPSPPPPPIPPTIPSTSHPAGCGFYAGAIGNHSSRIITRIPAGSGDTIKRLEEDPTGQCEKPNNCTKEITNIIKLMHNEAWPNWKAIPATTRDCMIEEKFTWDKDNDDLIKAAFNTHASKRFFGMMEDVREQKEHLTQSCRPELKMLLYHYWEIDEKYLHRKTTNKRNRAFEKCGKYTGGSTMPMQTKANMTKSLDRPVSMAEVFKQTNTPKANKEEFTDKRESGTAATVHPDQVWCQTVSESDDKNRIFGIGGFLASTPRTTVFAPQASSVSLTSPNPAGQEEAVDLREHAHLLNQNIQDMARQLHEFEERYQTFHDELSQRPGEHRRQIDVTGEQMHESASSAVEDLPLHPPAQAEDDVDYLDL
ncbi:hypothetical protein PIB30_011811 [Stylosanthes scabra]|uniref:Retrotransposon gag domain-containing protein n=1 Tax=Stylosanthes scabra TaxID=79078 RepID=A0ABU6S6K4_9FABA|nr:hypothetical protein [Stylosanthes scabra]